MIYFEQISIRKSLNLKMKKYFSNDRLVLNEKDIKQQ